MQWIKISNTLINLNQVYAIEPDTMPSPRNEPPRQVLKIKSGSGKVMLEYTTEEERDVEYNKLVKMLTSGQMNFDSFYTWGPVGEVDR